MSAIQNKLNSNSLLVCFTLFVCFFSYGFTIYDATLYKDKPDLSRYGIKPLTVFYAQHVWPNKSDRKNPPTAENAKKRLERSKSKPGDLIVLDFEQWPLQGYRYKPWIYRTSISNYSETIDLFKLLRPDLRFGFFGVVPVNNFQRASLSTDSQEYRIWQKDVNRLTPVARKIDVAFPVAYTYTDDPVVWNTYFSATMMEVRKLFKGEVYPFLWPQYFDHPPAPKHLQLQYIEAAFWRFQLETVARKADGVVIWGGWDFEKRRAAKWDDKALWWQTTKQFIKKTNALNQ